MVPLLGASSTIETTNKLGASPVSCISLAVNVAISIGWLKTAVNLTGLDEAGLAWALDPSMVTKSEPKAGEHVEDGLQSIVT